MNNTTEYPINRFLAFVRDAVMREDRGVLAELRRGLSETTQECAWPHLIEFCGDFDTNRDHRIVWCTIGGLSALLMADHLDSSSDDKWRNLGTTMRELAKGGGKGDDERKALKTYEPLFRRLLSASDSQTLCAIVSRIGQTADGKSVKMNLVGLFWDLWNWDDPEKREEIRLRWAKEYFKSDTTASTDKEKAVSE